MQVVRKRPFTPCQGIAVLKSETFELTCSISGVLTRYCTREYNCQGQLRRGCERRRLIYRRHYNSRNYLTQAYAVGVGTSASWKLRVKIDGEFIRRFNCRRRVSLIGLSILNAIRVARYTFEKSNSKLPTLTQYLHGHPFINVSLNCAFIMNSSVAIFPVFFELISLFEEYCFNRAI